VGKERSVSMPSILRSRVMQRGEGSEKEEIKDRRTILREEKLKKEKTVEVRKTGVEKKEDSGKKKEKLLREVMVKIGLKQEEEKVIVVETLLDSGTTGLVMSEEFTKKYKFKRKKLERPIFVRNIDETMNFTGPIMDIVEVKLFFRGHKERTLIDVIEG